MPSMMKALMHVWQPQRCNTSHLPFQKGLTTHLATRNAISWKSLAVATVDLLQFSSPATLFLGSPRTEHARGDRACCYCPTNDFSNALFHSMALAETLSDVHGGLGSPCPLLLLFPFTFMVSDLHCGLKGFPAKFCFLCPLLSQALPPGP